MNTVAESAVPDVLGPDLKVVFCGINPGRVSDAARAHFANPRNDFWRLLHAGRVHAAAARTARAVRAPAVRDRRDERGLPHDPGLERPASCGLRRLGRTSRAPRPRAPTASDRVRRQGGLPGRIRHACGARRPDANARRRGLVRPALDLARERGGPVRRAARMVPRTQGVARPDRPRSCASARRGRRGPNAPRPVPRRERPGLVGDARRRHRRERGRSNRRSAASWPRSSVSTSSSSAPSSGRASTPLPGTGGSFDSASGSGSWKSRPTSPHRGSTWRRS